MSTNGAKLSFSFGGAASKPSVPAAATGMSNMELLLAQAKAKSFKPKPASNLFGDDDDEDRPPKSAPSVAGPSKPSSRPQIKQNSSISRAERRAQQEALKVDSTVFDYDGVYDGMKAAERKLEQAKKTESEERKPKYIESFLASAQTRRLDRLRAEEKMLALEREKEGDEFKDKEFFVTDAYKKQMEEVRKAEEEEKKRDGRFDNTLCLEGEAKTLTAVVEALRKSKKGPGLTAFYKSMLDDDAEKHAAAVAAANGSVASGPSLAIKRPTQEEYEPEAEYDPFLARQAATEDSSHAGTTKTSDETGKEVEINDEGEVVDKRSLLKAGLNIMKKPSAALPNSLLTSQRSGVTLEGPYKSRAVGTAASYQERMERERKRLAEQMRLEAEKKRADEEARLKEEEEAARRRREGDDGEAQRKREEAKERFLARKRAREESDFAKKRQKEE